jgi:hypothetical protein
MKGQPTMKSYLLPAIMMLLFLAATPGGWTQFPIPQQTALTGSTPGATLRNAAVATQNQADLIRKFANDWGRRANSASYNADFLQQDFAIMQSHFQGLRTQFNWLGNQALQLGRSRADNAVAELDAGLNIIAELFTFLNSQYSAGTLDRRTIVRTCRSFEEAMGEWQREFKKNSSRLGFVW